MSARDHKKSNGTRGYYAYAKLMRSIQEADVGTNALAEKYDLSTNSVYEILRRLHRQRVIHIGSWEREKRRGCGFYPVWRFGEGRDADRPMTKGGTPSRRKRPERLPFRTQVFTFGLLMLALRDGHGALAICDLTGLERHMLDDLVKFMRSLHLVHITEWHRNPVGSPTPIFKLGDKRNAVRPKPLGAETPRALGYLEERERREEWRSLLHLVAAPLPYIADQMAA